MISGNAIKQNVKVKTIKVTFKKRREVHGNIMSQLFRNLEDETDLINTRAVYDLFAHTRKKI